jgi:hypothetical protein
VSSVTGQLSPVELRLPLPFGFVGWTVAPDGTAIYYGGERSEADIWIAERTQPE